MGAQETLLLDGPPSTPARGGSGRDGPADFALQYRNFPRLTCDKACLARGWGPDGLAKQRLARKEIGGITRHRFRQMLRRSAAQSRTPARSRRSCVPVQIWWSRTDKIISTPHGSRAGCSRRCGASIRTRRSTSTSATGITRTQCATRPTLPSARRPRPLAFRVLRRVAVREARGIKGEPALRKGLSVKGDSRRPG